MQPVDHLVVVQLGKVGVILSVIQVFFSVPVTNAPVPLSTSCTILASTPWLGSSLGPLLELGVQLPAVGLPVPLLLAMEAQYVSVRVGLLDWILPSTSVPLGAVACKVSRFVAGNNSRPLLFYQTPQSPSPRHLRGSRRCRRPAHEW